MNKLIAFFSGTKSDWDALEANNMTREFLEAAASLREGYKPNRHLIVKHE